MSAKKIDCGKKIFLDTGKSDHYHASNCRVVFIAFLD